MASSHNIKLSYTFRPDPLFSEYEANDDLLEKQYSIFPLLTGKGMEELIRIYNRTLSVNNLDYIILCFTQVIEYIAPTVAREKLNSDVMQKLSSPNVFNPDARYIIELQRIYEINDKYKNDKELIKLAIDKVLDIDEIKDILPNFIYKFKAKQADISSSLRGEISSKLASAISDTRNQIAHAKANYQCKGNECPEEQKEQFVGVLSIIARQAVRWFANEPEEKRVV